MIRETNYSKPWECNGVKDLRYIKKEEINKLKKRGYDGIIYEQYGWFICFKEQNI